MIFERAAREGRIIVSADTALHHGLDPGAPGERYQVVVHVDAGVLADAGGAGPVRSRGWGARSSWNVPAEVKPGHPQRRIIPP